MRSAGTVAAKARSASSPWSRAEGIIPISFSTWTIRTVWVPWSIARRCFSTAANARASVSRFTAANGDRISCGVPARSVARGKRRASRFTHAGA